MCSYIKINSGFYKKTSCVFTSATNNSNPWYHWIHLSMNLSFSMAEHRFHYLASSMPLNQGGPGWGASGSCCELLWTAVPCLATWGSIWKYIHTETKCTVCPTLLQTWYNIVSKRFWSEQATHFCRIQDLNYIVWWILLCFDWHVGAAIHNLTQHKH